MKRISLVFEERKTSVFSRPEELKRRDMGFCGSTSVTCESIYVIETGGREIEADRVLPNDVQERADSSLIQQGRERVQAHNRHSEIEV